MANEKKTDIIIAQMLAETGIGYEPNGSTVKEVQEALATSSKRGTGRKGFPEFTAQVGDFILVIEDKAEVERQAKYMSDKADTLLMDTPSVTDYAENGALHYALNIIEKTTFKRVIAFGCSGTERGRMAIRPIFVSPTSYKLMPRVKDFKQFSADNIERYYREKVCGNKPVEQMELEDIISKAAILHEDLRSYGQLGETEKPLVVSAILLALQEPSFSTEQLTADTVKTDGQKIFDALCTHMERVQVQPQVKKDLVLNQFRFIVDSTYLSAKEERLGKSPLRYFAEYLHSNILTAIVNNSPEDVLGRFYGEFIRYSGGDGQSLGVVLTPKHITELMAELIDVRPDDRVFDPCCGTGGFLIAAMHRMLTLADESLHDGIRRNNLHGIELRSNMFSIATTNMILRGDGKSNLICDDFLRQPIDSLRSNHYTKALMNPPYSQGKKKEDAHLTELKFIVHLLDSMADGARVAVIVPQSTMVGKSREDKADKQYILEHHTLEGVITLNTQTFYGVGTNPVIAVFTAHQPHGDRYAKFFDFKDDGYEVFAHVGLLPTVRAKQRRKLLMDCWAKGRTGVPVSFMVTSDVKPDDEWLHSFYYFNEEPPTAAAFEQTMADYLSFEFSMLVHGRGYLFNQTSEEATA